MTIQLESQYRGESFKAPPIKMPAKETGFYHSASVLKSPQFVFDFLQNQDNILRSLENLPADFENYLNLELIKAEAIDADEYEISWRNSEDATVKGILNFHCQRASENRGTILLAQAIFDNFSTKEDDPSELIRFFLKRLKALMETGVLATTKGQPTGQNELKQLH